MIICVCKGVSDKKIESLVRSGCKSLESIQGECRAGTDCGMCLAKLSDLLKSQKDDQAASTGVQAS